MSPLHGTDHWSDSGWRRSLEDQLADELERLRLLLRRRSAWLRHRDGREPLSGGLAGVVTGAEAASALASPSRVAEAEFYRADPEAVELGRAARDLEGQAGERARAMRDAGTPLPLDGLADAFGLGGAAVEVIRLALAPELDGGFERAFAWVHDDARRRRPTPALAAALFGGGPGSPSGVAAALAPDAPLFRQALLRPPDPEAPAALRPLRLEPRIVWYLQGVDHGGADGALQPLAAGSGAEVVEAAGRVAQALLDGPDGTLRAANAVGGTWGEAAALAAAVADALGMVAVRVVRPADREATPETPRLEREAVLRRALLFLEVDGAGDGEEADGLELAESLAAPLVVWSRHPVRLGRPVVSVPTPRTGPTSARAAWRRALGPTVRPSAEALDRVVHHFALDPQEIERVAAAARSAARLGGREVTEGEIWTACRLHGRRRLGALAQRIEPGFGWDDIVLPTDVRRQLGEIVDQVRNRALVHERWRFGDRLARGGGVTALFSGPSGTGKTMAAEVVAGELELDLYRIDLAGVVSKYIGETEKNLREIFSTAEASGAVLFFDEADALFGKRTDVRDSHDRYANIEVDYLLQRMESYRGLAVLATNRRTALDRAFLRRLRFLVDFPFPAADVRLRIWQRVLPEAAPRADLDYASLARMELAGGNIRGIAVNAAFLAAADGRVITMEHLGHAAAREYAKLDKTPVANELGEPARRPAP